MSDDRKTDEEKFAKILRDFGQRGARDRRERIATAMLAGGSLLAFGRRSTRLTN